MMVKWPNVDVDVDQLALFVSRIQMDVDANRRSSPGKEERRHGP